MPDYDYDLITLGAGSGGVAASRRASALGAKVAIIEGSRVGGTCVIRGCVPKKLMMYAAQLGDALHEARGYGWLVEAAAFDMAPWAAQKAAETRRLEGVYRQLLNGAGVQVIDGWARIDGPNTVVVGEQRLTARHLLIATGARPVRDSIEGIGDCPTSDDVLDLQAVPAEVGVIGGGYIGVEFASILARLGARVHLFYRDRQPLRGFDDDLRTRVAQALEAAGVVLHPGQSPQRVARQAEGYELHMPSGMTHRFPFVLNATGRRPNTQGLGLDTLGLQTDRVGAVPVNERFETPVPGVHAIGDVTNKRNLTPVAIAEGRAWADAHFGSEPGAVALPDFSLIATAVFTLPPVGTIGPSEADALAAGHTLKVFEADFRPMKQTFIGGAERSYMKLLVDADTDRVLAVHMIGADAPEIVQSLAVALTCGATKAQFDRTVAVHPTSAEEFVLMRQPARVVKPGA